MIKCTVCLTENDDFAVTCTSCKAFLQNRVPNLDLFDIGWKVLESPRQAFRTITLAEHKNYALFLFTLFGVSLSFTGFWYYRLGTQFISLIDLIPAAVGIGVVLGLLASVVITGIYYGFAKILGGTSGFRTSLGVLGYSITPITFSLVLVLPIELMTFGMYLFTSNPSPYTIKPVSYVLLIGFDAIVSTWSIVLAVIGTRVAHRINIGKSIVTVLGTLGIFLGGLLVLLQQFYPGIHV
jgi:hypothetical protein